MADHVADDQTDATVRERDHVVPVAADLGSAGGQVARGHVEAWHRRQPVGNQPLLEGLGDLARPLVELGVLDGQAGLSAQIDGHRQIGVVEPATRLGRHHGHGSEHPRPAPERYHDRRLDAEGAEDLELLGAAGAAHQELVGDGPDQLWFPALEHAGHRRGARQPG